MDSYRSEATVSDGEIHLDHLPFKDGERVEVTVNRASKKAKGWPKGYFEATFGAIQDPSFVRHPQGDFEKRKPMN